MLKYTGNFWTFLEENRQVLEAEGFIIGRDDISRKISTKHPDTKFSYHRKNGIIFCPKSNLLVTFNRYMTFVGTLLLGAPYNDNVIYKELFPISNSTIGFENGDLFFILHLYLSRSTPGYIVSQDRICFPIRIDSPIITDENLNKISGTINIAI